MDSKFTIIRRYKLKHRYIKGNPVLVIKDNKSIILLSESNLKRLSKMINNINLKFLFTEKELEQLMNKFSTDLRDYDKLAVEFGSIYEI